MSLHERAQNIAGTFPTPCQGFFGTKTSFVLKAVTVCMRTPCSSLGSSAFSETAAFEQNNVSLSVQLLEEFSPRKNEVQCTPEIRLPLNHTLAFSILYVALCSLPFVFWLHCVLATECVI